MKVLAFDLEMNQPSNSIIQVGYCVGETNNGKIYDKVQFTVNCHEEIDPFITELTGIDQIKVNLGYPLLYVYNMLKRDHKFHSCFINPVVWGHGDAKLLREQLAGLIDDESEWCLGRRIIDTKTIYQAWRTACGDSVAGGLKKACEQLGLEFEGKAHTALDDAINTFRVYYALLQKFK